MCIRDRKDHHHATITQPLQRRTYRRRITPFKRERPCAEPLQTRPNNRPAERRTPREITCRSLDRKRKPEWIDVRLMIRRYDHSPTLGYVLDSRKLNLPQ